MLSSTLSYGFSGVPHVSYKIKQPWRIIHTNPDLSGIQAAIREGLGVTVLAESTVPEGLAIIDRYGKSDTLPKLGSIDISLLYERD